MKLAVHKKSVDCHCLELSKMNTVGRSRQHSEDVHTLDRTLDTDLSDLPALSMDLRFLFVASALLLGAALTISLADRVSTCKVKWLFGISCADVTEKLVNQIKEWQISQSCQYEGERCSYELVSTAPYVIKATHTSPTTKITSDLEFLLEQSTVCKMSGEAVSEFSKDPADNSTNFCSLQNLMDGSDLVSAEGYKQFSNKWICPGFDTANCTLS
ncbi:uncharacterized protein wu:fc46h12 isoform X1 [Epinephelus fuscoguttatus]|uniref:uncharacterized protein wu:fc46h12 isoform X1 n=2 Tax=Epinephelus TaxID=94231 RepID=UPI0020D045CC|nr:uncharacterized protein wu:fc46h12 isoform X1 [Epinephelus fuscoguttatus]